jgi:hypothetical protein
MPKTVVKPTRENTVGRLLTSSLAVDCCVFGLSLNHLFVPRRLALPRAELQQTDLSDFLEQRIAQLLEGSGSEPVIVRMLMNAEKEFDAPPLRTARYLHGGAPGRLHVLPLSMI